MDSKTIKESIANWEAIRQNSVQVTKFFEQGNTFAYSFPAYASTSGSIHAYPGIHNNILYFFLIPSAYDKQEYSDVIDQYTSVCLVVHPIGGGGGHEISSLVAKERIANWDKNYHDWVPVQINSTFGMYEAFCISTEDFEVEKVTVSFALKASPAAEVNFQADLIITNDKGKQVVYDDFVEPVPPFGLTDELANENFYLLQEFN
ncbi:hypothetical protein [Flavobacterium sp. NRK1]|uniref:hypothetical protein n=1 Tax=Flavobacterium sp. NRK1 TaxID=2954929 RepID=UPI002092DB1A|nr:hypothetical protein [Flavobacterium sp. NRK1]MCO6149581.1 hypothetical protein [Flavobacterium sp. NRK1]